MVLNTWLVRIPSFQNWISQVLDDVRDGRSVIVLLPDGIDAEIVRAALWNSQGSLYFEGIFLTELGAQRPVEAVATALSLDVDHSNIDRLVRQSGFPDVLFLDDFDELSENDREEWLQFMSQWADVCQRMKFVARNDATTAPTLCLVAHASRVPDKPSLSTLTNVLLGIQVLWGVPSALEMRLLTRLVSEGHGTSFGRWQECLIPSIAGSDLSLAEYMMTHEIRSLGELVEGLLAFGHSRSWSQHELEEAWIHGFQWDDDAIVSGRIWTYPFFHAWARGMLYWTPEYGMEIHSSALAFLGRREVVEHRYWRGQTQLILPQIDELRLALCISLTHSYGKEWPFRWIEPKNKEEQKAVRCSPFACQWGHLQHLLRHCRMLRSESRWCPLVESARIVRNELSHYRPVSLDTYQRLYEEAKRGIKGGLAMPSW